VRRWHIDAREQRVEDSKQKEAVTKWKVRTWVMS